MPDAQERIRQITRHLSELSQQYREPDVFATQMDDYLAKLKEAGELDGLSFEDEFSIYWAGIIFSHHSETLL